MNVASLPFLSFLSGAVALDRTPVFCDDKTEKWMTYADLRREVKELLSFFQSPRKGLVLCAPSRTISGTTSLLGAMASGQAVLLLDPDATRILPFIESYEPEWVVTPSRARPSDSYDAVDWPVESLTLWRRVCPCEKEVHPDLFLLLLPAGGGDATQTVRLSYANVSSNVAEAVDALSLAAEERILSHLPLSYSFGLTLLLYPLAVGGSALLTELDFKNRAFWAQAQRREVTLFPGIPLHYDYIVRARLEKLGLPRVKTFWQAGGRLSGERQQELMRQIEERQGRLFVLFGHAEAAPRMSVLPLHDRRDKLGSVGQALRGGKFEIEDGEVVYSGPNVMMGYAQDRKGLSCGDRMKGRLFTGEYGFLDEDGFLFLMAKNV